ncbi:MAG: hypothetical protein EOP00_17115 [Pedobacter sp.]|nr:MAG: hypothetical protein EOP00_17115 [Pedobacter sp.]
MKILMFSICFLWVLKGFAQQPNKLYEEESRISRILSKNLNSNLKEDTTYTFAIEIIPSKSGYIANATDKIAYEIFGNIDSLFKQLNFDLFQDRKAKRRLIIPVGIVVVNSSNENKGAIINAEKLPFAVDKMFNVSDKKDRYQSIYLRPFFAILDKVIYN